MGAIAEGAAGAGGGAVSHVTAPAMPVAAPTVEPIGSDFDRPLNTPQARAAVVALDQAQDIDAAVAAAQAIVDAPVTPVIARAQAFAQAEQEAGERKTSETEAAYKQREDRIADLNRQIEAFYQTEEQQIEAAKAEVGRNKLRGAVRETAA